MTANIRAAAQALWDAVDARHDQPAPLKYTIPYGAVVALGAALAEPAKPAPACEACSTCGDMVVSMRDHLAAMEALRADNERLKADRSAQVATVMRLVAIVAGKSYEHDFLAVAESTAATEAAVRKLAGEA